MRRSDREIMNIADVEAIIKEADVCRIALIDGEMPYLVTLNFGYKAGNPAILYFHCANKGRKIDVIEKNNSACFQMDIDHELITAEKACGFAMNFKSIVGNGKIYKVETSEEKIEGLNYIMKQYTGKDQFDYEEKMLDITTILRLEVDQMTAKHKK
ncbi:MAG: pyridoxamine 5'-phosphate oxidase family protein [Bacteroidales bacterium]|nr:pyridoxamine 5'-phosphate oxidase family protein [Bacteroidales bacterium]